MIFGSFFVHGVYFCVFVDECRALTHAEKNKRAAEKWSLQTDDEKRKYGETAIAISSVDVRVLDDNQKKKLVERHCKKLQEEVSIVESWFLLR